jgi:hypothetical protein
VVVAPARERSEAATGDRVGWAGGWAVVDEPPAVLLPSTAKAARAAAMVVFRAGRSSPRVSGDMTDLLGTPAKVDLSD